MKWNYFLPLQGWLLGCFIFIYTTGFSTSSTDHTPSNFQVETDRIFESDELLSLTILSDFSSIMDDRGEDRSYHKGMMYYLNGDDTIFQKVKLKTRGNFRLDPKNCKYPPIMVKFGKLMDSESVFADQSKLKLVTQCQIEDYVLLEFLAYRIFNLLTDNSYRVRLAHITYADQKTKVEYFTRYAFFIENEKELATRLHADIYKPNVVQYFLNRKNIMTVAMFQYLIGNDDWYVTSKHNTSILKKNENLIAVPYDFDWSELVGAKYTRPVGIPSNQLKARRVYKGLCMETEDFEKQKDLFAFKKDEIVELIRSQEDLPKKRKQESIKYIEKFYKTLNNPSSIEHIFQKEKCIEEPVFEQ